MKARAIAFFFLLGLGALAADLPTVTIEHLYYLSARGEALRGIRDEDMVDYCLAQKLGGPSLESLYQQVLSIRTDLMKLQELEGVSETDPRVAELKRKRVEYEKLLFAEARKIKKGLMQEGEIADTTLRTIGRAQSGR